MVSAHEEAGSSLLAVDRRIVIKPVTVLLIILGLLLVAVGIVYFVTPARDLPSVFPGRDPALTRHHVTHGLAAVVVALVVWAGAWFTTSPNR
ncbi:MAG: hypothetical protein NVSMB16_15260 [Acidimicrobiales bacterium]